MSRGVLGIFVGGRARRMGGFPKGLLPASHEGESIVQRLLTRARDAGMDPVFVGDATAYREAAPEILALVDRPQNIGPLGGLAALLAHAGDGRAIAVACDMPFVTSSLLQRLHADPSRATIVATRRSGIFEPFLARYDARAASARLAECLHAGARSFQQFFAACDVTEWPLSPDEHAAWNDWDTPDDLPAWAR